jgi:hypothetical protein
MRIKKITLLLAAAAVNLAGWSYDFTTKNSDGVRLYYKITSSTIGNRTVEVASDGESVVAEYVEKDVRIPSTVTNNGRKYTVTGIGDSAFARQYNMPSVVLPNTITYIGKRAFYYCQVLTSANIPASVTNIGSEAFANCFCLKDFTFEATQIDADEDAFSNCQCLLEPVCTDSLFMYLSQVASMRHPSYRIADGTKAILDGAFANSLYLKSLTIPASVENIHDMDFYYTDDWNELESIYIAAATPPATMSLVVNSKLAKKVTLYVSDDDPAIIEAYKSSSFWGQFKNIVATSIPESSTNKFDVNSDGDVNSADVVAIYNYIANADSSGLTEDAADANSDGEVNSADIVAIYNYIQNGTAD